MDTYQGKIGTISPAVGNYDILTHIDIDKVGVGATGIPGATGSVTGVVGEGTLLPLNWEQGITGIQAENFTNAKHGF